MKIMAKIEMMDTLEGVDKEDFLSLSDENKVKFVEMYKESLYKILKNEVQSNEIYVDVYIAKEATQ